ncbi:hypothetical protein M3Y94_00716000 [Aphelenchoides besseyi]|nr:hypothetical protein M3Y94_00716000 [Aphelenchoides besseyi]
MLPICVLFLTVEYVFAKAKFASEYDKDNDFGVCWAIGVFTLVFVVLAVVESGIVVVYLAMRQTAVTDTETNAKKVAKLNSDREYYKQAVDEWEAKVAKCKEKLRQNMKLLEKRESDEEEVIENWMQKVGRGTSCSCRSRRFATSRSTTEAGKSRETTQAKQTSLDL